MRRTFGAWFLAIYLAVLLVPSFHIVYFFANQEYIQTYLCINKDKPELQCEGHCFLAQKIQQSYSESSAQAPYNIPTESLIFLMGFVNSTQDLPAFLQAESMNSFYTHRFDRILYVYEKPYPS